jgi:hypothetical protein
MTNLSEFEIGISEKLAEFIERFSANSEIYFSLSTAERRQLEAEMDLTISGLINS